jgi:cellulose synthase/poly-beta-1,6-N-acetylglucosamine synthase-like glycosyltransferase
MNIELVFCILLTLTLLSYYWTIHPLVLTIYYLAKSKTQRKSNKINRSIGKRISWKNVSVYIIIPTFGNREIIIEKIKHLNNLFNKDRVLSEIVSKVIIVYSKPDDKVLKNIIEIINEDCRSKYILVLENYRGGKAEAINTALKLIDGELEKNENYIVIISDDDLFFDATTVKEMLQTLNRDELLGIISVAPKYNSFAINLFYKLKRKVHSIEERICAPATIYGDLLAFKRGIITYIDENSLAEDLQLCLKAVTEGFKAKIIIGNVHENYPQTLRGMISRTRRTIVGTFIEYQKFIKDIVNKRGFFCAYIYSSYIVSLLLLSPLLLLFIISLGVSTYNISSLMLQTLICSDGIVIKTILLTIASMLASFTVYYLYASHKAVFLVNVIRFILALIIGGIASYVDILRLLIGHRKNIDFDKMWANAK